MDDLLLPVTYRGKEMEFPVRIVPYGYTFRYFLLVQEVQVIFERDDSGDLRALIEEPEKITAKMPDKELLQLIAETLRSL